jgi:hemerythrin superfamily protein
VAKPVRVIELLVAIWTRAHRASARGPPVAPLVFGLHMEVTMGIVRTLLGKDTTTDVIDLLMAQHLEVDTLIAQIEAGEGDGQAAFAELANKLAAHAAAEEQVFYPAVMAKQTNELLLEAVEEHLAVKRVLADMLALRVGEPSFKAKLAVLKEEVTHHAHREEEGKLFPQLRSLMTSDERAALGNEVLVKFEELMQAQPAQRVPRETRAAAPLPAARR